WDVCEIVLAAVSDGFAVDDELVLFAMDLPIPAPMQGVEIKHVGGSQAVAADFIEMDEFKFREVPASPEGQPAHASEAVNADAGGHKPTFSLSWGRFPQSNHSRIG